MKRILRKTELINNVIEDLKKSFANDDYTVLEELLDMIPIKNLICALPEEDWKVYEIMGNKNNIWVELYDNYHSDRKIYIDAFETNDQDEEGKTIAIINQNNYEITYVDERAKEDLYAQAMIADIIFNIKANCLHDWDDGFHNVSKCKKCGKYSC